MKFAAVLSLMLFGLSGALAAEPADARFFETRVRPLLADHCYSCHGPQKQKSDLRLDSAAAFKRGGSSGEPLIDTAKPEQSLLLRLVQHADAHKRMPPKQTLSEKQIADLALWVKAGAVFPANVEASPGDKHWAFQKRVDPAPPAVKDAAWAKSPLDAFVLAKLEAKNLKPAPPADRRTLIRRATFDLTGLPPTPAEVDAFLKDTSPTAYESLINRLLASPAYGERWGRHWLDVARYADSNGLDENVAFGNAWRYRDYVVNAFNTDKPFDQFLTEQLAGDLLPASDAVTRRERLIATGFLALGPKVLAEVDEKKMEMDIVDEQVDTVGQAFLGLTLGCARCHNHKFDPVTIDDYYALAGIFQSTKTMEHFKKVARWYENPLATPWQFVHAGGELPTALGVTDGAVMNTPVLLRGDHLTPGKLVPRRFPVILAGETQTPLAAADSGRLALAKWLVKNDHPLTARVMVNRVWRHHFGHGIVRSVDNFGLIGEKPSHPELLDWLAARFVEGGWSVKTLHRQIMLSATYQTGSDYNAKAAEADPDNRLLWRANVRRLEAEAIRDSLLAVSGSLDKTMGGPSLQGIKNRDYLFDHTSKDKTTYDTRRRSVYLPVIRNNIYDVFQLFDGTDATVINGNRATTTVATQALFMLNGPLMMDSAAKLTGRLLADESLDDAARVRLLYEIAYGRPPTEREADRAQTAIARFEKDVQGNDRRAKAWALFGHVVLAANEFVYVN